MNEGRAFSEELTFNTKNAVPINVDAAILYQLDREKVPALYANFRVDRIETFAHDYLHDTAHSMVVATGSEYNFGDMSGDRKEEFVVRLTRELDTWLAPLGVSIRRFDIVNLLRPPRALFGAASAKTKAIQDTTHTENEVHSVQAEVKRKVAIVRGGAAVSHTLTSSLDNRLLAWGCLKFERAVIERWNGTIPSVMAGDNGDGVFSNIPAEAQSE